MNSPLPSIPTKFQSTLGSDIWLEENKEVLLKLFPDNWEHIQNINPLVVGFKLKVLGVEWNTEMEFGFAMMFLVRKGFALHDPKNKFLVKRADNFKLITSYNQNAIFRA